MSVKFAPCECSAADEVWKKTNELERGRILTVAYECQTCGESYMKTVRQTRA